MIKFKDKIYENFFIDLETAVITNEKGEIQETKIRDGRPVFKSMEIHQIQAHTHLGYKKGFDVHHIDKNKMNNSLSNLIYLTRNEYSKLHHKCQTLYEETKKKMSESLKGRKHKYIKIMKKLKKSFILTKPQSKKIKLYTEKYRKETGEFCSMEKFVENLLDKFCQLNLELLLQKHRETENDEKELISIIEEECENIIKENKIGGK